MLLTALAALAVGASNAPPVAHLTWHEFGAQDRLTGSVPTSFYGLYQDNQAIEGYTAPEGLIKPRFFMINQSQDQRIVGVLGRSKADGKIDRAWVDWNGNHKFEPNEEAKTTGKNDPRWGAQAVVLEFAKVPVGPSGPIHVKLLVMQDQMVSLQPTGAMEGKVEVAGNTASLAIIDANCNGVFGDTSQMGMSDYMALDTSGSGNMAAGLSQIMPLMQFADGKFYKLDIAKNGATVKIVVDETPTGTIEFKGGELQSVMLSTNLGPISVRAANGKVVVPQGSYILASAQFSIEKGNTKWMYMVARPSGPKVVVTAGHTTAIEIGGPLKLGVTAAGAGMGPYAFSLSLKDRSGADVQGLYDPKMQRPPAPKLVITDPTGQVAKTLPFAYG